MFVGADVHVFDPQVLVFEKAVGIGQVGFSFPDRFDLRSGKHDAGFPGFRDEKMEGCFSVDNLL